MKNLSDSPDKSLRVIDEYLSERLKMLEGKDRAAIISEFKEWVLDTKYDDSDVWTIPDLTDDGLCDFFKRAISRN